jgi:hypothetical protein
MVRPNRCPPPPCVGAPTSQPATHPCVCTPPHVTCHLECVACLLRCGAPKPLPSPPPCVGTPYLPIRLQASGLQCLSIASNGCGPVGLAALVPAVAECATLVQLIVSDGGMPADAGRAIGALVA